MLIKIKKPIKNYKALFSDAHIGGKSKKITKTLIHCNGYPDWDRKRGMTVWDSSWATYKTFVVFYFLKMW